ncbi:DUF4389 domain-containing protein [Kitasatospora sp. RB6PN24]|uniref:DUF4389 domain-containing protein n=1 Tax=Kitasatospora humi TaxID=2893891 RepID=UPI001E3F8C4E|nr:DUF4389 domain-containing protein [Kitasatospora humi]MCC9308796.1 DUF4389 domain-containing protein [Kitasatospora humi]
MAEVAGGWSMPVAAGPPEFLPVLDVPGPGRQRRLTVLFRWLILVPHFIVVWVLSIAAFFAVIVGWFAALLTARLPPAIARYLADFLGYDTRLMASQFLLIDRYPPFSLRQPPEYPVRIEVRPGLLNRAAVFFRLILMIPAAIISGLLSAGWLVLAFFIWLWTLITARLPRPLFEAQAALVRYRMRFIAYSLMLTSAYPKRLFGDPPTDEPPLSATRPLLVGTAGKALLVVFLVLGLGADIGSSASSPSSPKQPAGTINTAPHYRR